MGTNLVTCLKQPALGCVYKLVEINNVPRIKLSQEIEKVVTPCRKVVYRLTIASSPFPTIDVIQMETEPPPQVGVRVLCRHPFQESKRVQIVPASVTPLLEVRRVGVCDLCDWNCDCEPVCMCL